MLVLTRGKFETIRIGNAGEIKVTVVEIRGDKVRLGIEAAKDVVVDREEVFQSKQIEKKQKGTSAA